MDSNHLSIEKKVFQLIGGYGPWQRRICFILSYACMVNILHTFSILYMTPKEDYWCVSPLWMSDSSLNFSVSTNRSTLAENERPNAECWKERSPGSTHNVSMPCTKWDYRSNYYSKGIVSEWDLICDREWLVSFVKSVYLFGFAFGIFTGNISDRFGRFPVIVGAAVLSSVSALISAFSTSYTMFSVLRFLIALGRITVTNTGYVLLIEIVDSQNRNWVTVALNFGYAAGFFLIPGIGWLIRRWSWIILAIEAVNLPMMFMLWFIPESPRWLFTQRNYTKFSEVVEKAAKRNGLVLSHQDIEMLFKEESGKVSKKGIVHLLKLPKERIRLLVMAFIWISVALMFYTVSFNIGDLSGNLYLNGVIMASMNLLSKIMLFLTLHRAGRKKLLGLTMFIVAAMFIGIAVVPSSYSSISTTFAMVQFFCAAFMYGVLYLLTSESFATVVRNSVFSTCSSCSRVGAILGPFMKEFAKATNKSAPNGLNAALAIAAGLSLILLPETKDIPIDDTLRQEGRRDSSMQHAGDARIVVNEDVVEERNTA